MEENRSAMYCSLRAEKVLKSLPELETSIVQDGPFQLFFFFFSVVTVRQGKNFQILSPWYSNGSGDCICSLICGDNSNESDTGAQTDRDKDQTEEQLDTLHKQTQANTSDQGSF